MSWLTKAKTKDETPRHQDAKGTEKKPDFGFNLVSWRLGVSKFRISASRE
jgi:hypothetical protein